MGRPRKFLSLLTALVVAVTAATVPSSPATAGAVAQTTVPGRCC
ncbi:hypothetical protein [Micromonospora sp. ATA51]|nr:hypothetical protein [Micromonospora sp. ATA51]